MIDPTTPTGLSVVLTEGEDRATLTAQGTIGAVTAAMVSDELLRRARHVHTSSFFLAGTPVLVAELLGERGPPESPPRSTQGPIQRNAGGLPHGAVR